METKQNAIEPGLRPPSAGASKIVNELDYVNLPEELLTVLLHDLRSPLGAIGVLADLINSLSQDGKPADLKQLALLTEAVTKAQRVLDDAVEIQSYIRGSMTFTPAHIDIGAVVKACLEKASHAPYFRNVEVNYNFNGTGQQLVNVDVEKAETALLCAFEHIVSHAERPSVVVVRHCSTGSHAGVNISSEKAAPVHDSMMSQHRLNSTLKGRLGTRRLGESRYSLQVCKKVMALMGGELEIHSSDLVRALTLSFPCARR